MRPPGQGMPVRLLGFTENIRCVGFDRFDRNKELTGDFLICVASGQESKHLQFAPGKGVDYRVVNGGMPLFDRFVSFGGVDHTDAGSGVRPGKGVENEARKSGAKDGIAIIDSMASTSSGPEIDLVT